MIPTRFTDSQLQELEPHFFILDKDEGQVAISFPSLGDLINEAFDKGPDDPWLTPEAQESKRENGVAYQAFKFLEVRRWAAHMRSDRDSGKTILLRTGIRNVVNGLCVVAKETRANMELGSAKIPVLERRLLESRAKSDLPISLEDYLSHSDDWYVDELDRWGSNYEVRIPLQIAYQRARKQYIKEDEFYQIDLLAVSPTSQKQGIGRSLVEQTQVMAARDGLPVYVLTWPDAVGFYEKLGFTRLGCYEDERVAEPDVVMRWEATSE
ncbi:hypothetical protein F5Y18DRAFT_424334 [Xylariaceae sp. FL1019]|nr:hypothetical protein F5Y18DRAFT_424334 [Xylariaceae sp. FL1019]